MHKYVHVTLVIDWNKKLNYNYFVVVVYEYITDECVIQGMSTILYYC